MMPSLRRVRGDVKCGCECRIADAMSAPAGLRKARGQIRPARLDRAAARTDVGPACGRSPGQWFDPESGLHCNRFRYYSPDTGFYISREPIRLNGGGADEKSAIERDQSGTTETRL